MQNSMFLRAVLGALVAAALAAAAVADDDPVAPPETPETGTQVDGDASQSPGSAQKIPTSDEVMQRHCARPENTQAPECADQGG